MAHHPPYTRLPRLIAGVDLRTLPIGPAEAFVLSRIDGVTREFEIAEAAGLELSAVAATLSELERLGAIMFDEAAESQAQRPSPRPAASLSNPVRIGPIVEAVGNREPHHPAAALYDARELEEAVDLELERKQLILEAYYHLDSATHYQLLKVDPSADKRAIKNAYYEIVNVFHPDRYFGKSLGSFKPKLERVFSRLTDAYDVLTRSGPRAEYDAYLASLQKTRDFDQRQTDSTLKAQIQAIQRQIEEEARAAESASSGPSSIPAAAGRSIAPAPTSSQQPPPRSSDAQARLQSVRPTDPEARKRALARKLGGRSMSGPQPAMQPPPSQPAAAGMQHETRERAALDLKRRYDQRVTVAREQQAERYLLNARASLANKDPLSAVNGLRIAASLVPNNPEISARLQEAQTEAQVLLSDHYLAQAQYEEREGRLVDAARSYGRATAGSSSSRTFERAAYCTLMAEGDLRVAGDYARKALALLPAGSGAASAPGASVGEEAQARVTLARIYVAAGMKQSAVAEFERAATLAPKDDTIRDWIRRLKRGEA